MHPRQWMPIPELYYRRTHEVMHEIIGQEGERVATGTHARVAALVGRRVSKSPSDHSRSARPERRDANTERFPVRRQPPRPAAAIALAESVGYMGPQVELG